MLGQLSCYTKRLMQDRDSLTGTLTVSPERYNYRDCDVVTTVEIAVKDVERKRRRSQAKPGTSHQGRKHQVQVISSSYEKLLKRPPSPW